MALQQTKNFLFVVSVLICALGCPVRSQTCGEWIGGPKFCSQLVDYPVWEPMPNYQQLAFNATSAIGTAMLAIPSPCAEAFADIYCQHTFRRCDTSNGVPLPNPVCRSTCNTYRQYCNPVIAAMSMSQDPNVQLVAFVLNSFNCSAPDIMFNNTADQFPNGDANYYGFVVPCNDATGFDYAGICQFPLKYDTDLETCGLECPAPVFSWAQYRTLRILFFIFGYLGFVGSIFVIVTYSLIPEKRRNVAIGYAIATLLYCLSLVIQSWFPPRDVWCKSETKSSDQGVCKAIGSIQYYGLFSTHLWWFVIAFNMFYTVVLRKSRTMTMYIAYHVVGFGIPLVYLIVALSTDQVGYTELTGTCQLQNTNPGNAKDIAMYIAPLLAIACLGTPMLAITAYTVFNRYKGEKRSVLKSNIRVLLFLVLFLYYSASMSAVRIRGLDFQDSTIAKIQEWVRCETSALPGTNCRQTGLFPYSYCLWMTINISIVALSPMVFFGAKSEMVRWWLTKLSFVTGGSISFTQSRRSSKSKPDNDASKAYSRRSAEVEMDSTHRSAS